MTFENWYLGNNPCIMREIKFYRGQAVEVQPDFLKIEMALGPALGYSSLVGIAAILLVPLPSMIYRIWVDEKLLARHFGKLFDNYAAHTKRLNPGVW